VITFAWQIFLILFLTALSLKAFNLIMDRFFKLEGYDSEVRKRVGTLERIIRSAARIIIFIIAGTMLLEKMGLAIGPLLATAGVAGLAIGLGAKELVKDIIGGFFILLEDQIRVGDFIVIGDAHGTVEKVNLRIVVLRDPSANVHYIRNGSINVVTNMTKEYSRYVFDIGVAYREDTDEVVEVIKEVDQQLRDDPAFKDDILEPIEVLGVDKFADSAVIVKARTKTKPIRQWAVGREFNRRLKKRFDQLGIEIPFPHTTLYMGQDKKGNSPILNINVEKNSGFQRP